MINTIANIVIIAMGLHVVIGIVFYFYFIKTGVHKIDDGVKSAPLFMKILILPGTVALWPILLKKVKKEAKA